MRAAEELATVGLTTATFGLLNVIAAREGANQSELGTVMNVDRTTMVALVDTLEEAGLATRRPSPTDRRARVVAITAKGTRLLGRARRMIAVTEDAVLAGLAPGERETLVDLMRRALASAPSQPEWSAAEGD